jgi:ABC-type transport system involved in multi-copper enzyme maturation permease subunit
VTGFGALVRIFLRDLVRRRLLWALIFITAAAMAIIYWTTQVMEEAVGNGESWDIATRRAASQLDNLVSLLRPWLGFVVVLFAAQVAPESRRNGTTQFVLSLGVRRNVLAAAQYVAMAIMLAAAIGILHTGFSVAGVKTGYLNGQEIALSWIALLVPSLAMAASVFALSLTASAFETYLVFLGVPVFTRILPGAIGGFPKAFPLPLVRGIQNLGLLFPEFDELVLWPRLSFGGGMAAPHPQWHWALAHTMAAVAFWVVLGVWLQRRHDFGSRTALK